MKFQKRVWHIGDSEWRWEARVVSSAGFLLETVSQPRNDRRRSRDAANASALEAIEHLKASHRSRWVTVEEMA